MPFVIAFAAMFGAVWALTVPEKAPPPKPPVKK